MTIFSTALSSITRRMYRIHISVFVASISALLGPTIGRAESISAAVGVTFEAPTGMVVQGGQPSPIVVSWKDANNSVSVNVLSVPSSPEAASAAAKEFQDWPGAGRSFADGFGKSNAVALEKVLKVKCSFIGVPRSRDLERMGIQAEIDTTCKTAPNPYVVRSRIIQIVSRSNSVVFRIDSEPSADAKAQAITANIWQSIRVAADQRISLPHSRTIEGNSELSARPVTGGEGIKLRDYGLIRMAALVGEYIGGLVSGLLLGMLLSIVLIKLKVPPFLSLFSAQILISLFRIWGAEKNGTWEIDPILYLVTGAISVIVLRRWAQRRWEKTQASRVKGTAAT